MSNFIIDGIDFHNMEVQKYWQPPNSWTQDKKIKTTKDRIFSGSWYGARKMDGAFFEYIKSPLGEEELIGRSKSVTGDYLNKIEWVPHLKEFFDKVPNGSCVIGELYFPNNESARATTTITGCLKEKAVMRQTIGDKLHYYVFDVLAWNGQSFLNSKAEWRFNFIKEYSLNNHFKYVEFANYLTGEALWNELQEILAIGGEGIVMTEGSSLYQPGKRPSKTCQKVKKELQDTVDVFIMGANAPARLYKGKEIENWKLWEDPVTKEKFFGEYYKDYYNGRAIEPVTKTYFNGWAGSLIIGVYKNGEPINIGSLSGMTEEVLSNWKDYVGKVAEITAMEIMETGGLRHPKFVRWKTSEEKSKKDCLWSDIFER